MQEIIAKIRDILSTFQQQYKNAAADASQHSSQHSSHSDIHHCDGSADSMVGGVLPAIDDPNFEFFFEQLSESYA